MTVKTMSIEIAYDEDNFEDVNDALLALADRVKFYSDDNKHGEPCTSVRGQWCFGAPRHDNKRQGGVW